MIALIVLGSVGLYLAGLAFVARRLFCRWRPSRVPLCDSRSSHGAGCYRRRKADLTVVKIDSDPAAMGWAVAAALAWPFVLIGLALMARPPELPEEQARRVKELERKLADMEREAGVAANRD